MPGRLRRHRPDGRRTREILGANERAAVIEGDIRAPEAVLDDPTVRRMVELDEPVGLLLFAVPYLLSDDEDRRGDRQSWHKVRCPVAR